MLSKINVHSINLENEENPVEFVTANEAIVYYYSANKSFTFLFTIPQSSPESTLTINNKTQPAYTGINAVRIDNENYKEEITMFSLKLDDPFLVNKIAVSDMGGERGMR